jgi:hypothetical protein
MDYDTFFRLADILPSSFSLPHIPAQMGDAGLGTIGQKSAANWLINTGIRQKGAYEVFDFMTEENRYYESNTFAKI